MNPIITTIQINFSGVVEIELRESDIKAIAEDYKGDYDSYIRDLDYSKYDIEYDEDDRDYNTSPIKKALNIFKENNKMDIAFNYPPEVLSVNWLFEHQIPKDIFLEVLQEDHPIIINPSKEILENVYIYADTDNPKFELECIYFDEENIVATNTRCLIIYKNNTGLKNILIPKEFAKAYIHKDATLYLLANRKIYMELDDEYYVCDFYDFKYPDYKRIIPIQLDNEISVLELLENSKVVLNEYDVEILIYKLEKEHISINYKFIDSTFKTFKFNKYNLPAVFEDGNRQLIVMPICHTEQEVEELLNKEQGK